jgi:hypothetical protein
MWDTSTQLHYLKFSLNLVENAQSHVPHPPRAPGQPQCVGDTHITATSDKHISAGLSWALLHFLSREIGVQPHWFPEWFLGPQFSASLCLVGEDISQTTVTSTQPKDLGQSYWVAQVRSLTLQSHIHTHTLHPRMSPQNFRLLLMGHKWKRVTQ